MEISGNAITFSNTIQTTRVEGISTRELGSACKTTIENNMISGDFSREGIYVGSPCAYGIRSEAEAGSTVTLRHNSISIRGTNTTVPSAGFRLGAIPNQSFDSYGKVILRNNIIRAGMENCTAVETQGTSATIDSDFNALFAIPGANIGRCSQPPFGPAPPETLTWWQYVSGQDSHSVNIDPYVAAGEDSGVWVGPPDSDQADLHFTSYPGPDYLAPALTGVSIDIDREPRTGEQAVIGADTITIPPTRVEEWRLYQ